MPVCAGGKEKAMLKLERAEETDDGILLTFNLRVEISAEETLHYTFEPAAEITAAVQDPDKQFLIRLTASLEPDTEYQITVKDLVSTYDTDLDPQTACVKVIRKRKE